MRSTKKSVRQASHELPILVMTLWRVLRTRSQLRPYRSQLLQTLKPTDYGFRCPPKAERFRAKFSDLKLRCSPYSVPPCGKQRWILRYGATLAERTTRTPIPPYCGDKVE